MPKTITLEHSMIKLITHDETICDGNICPVHNMTEHSMRSFSQHWRSDRGLMERLCIKHGVGHPDPDHLASIERRFGSAATEIESIHGCCGCCEDTSFSNEP